MQPKTFREPALETDCVFDFIVYLAKNTCIVGKLNRIYLWHLNTTTAENN